MRSIGTDAEHSGDLKQNSKEGKYECVPENLDVRASFNSADANDGNRATSDESFDEESEHSTFDDNNDIWSPPEPESAEVDEAANMATFYDVYDEPADGDCREWVKSSSWKTFEEGVSASYLFKEEKQKAMEEVRNGKFKNLVIQLLKKFDLDNCNEEDESWVDIVTHLAWQAALYVNPDAIEGKSMDPSNHVKIKCIASGSRNESQLIKGLVFTKHASHKHMATKYKNPRLLLINGTLGPSSSGSSSFNSVLGDSYFSPNVTSYNSMSPVDDLVENLKACHPDVILVEKSASHDVLNKVLRMGVTLVLDMKLERLTKVYESTGLPILSTDNILNQDLKCCYSLYFEKFEEEHAPVTEGGKTPCKTLMFLEGCPTRLCCTILLKGSQSEELKRIKCVLQCAVVMAYNFILETSFLVDRKAMFSTITRGQATDIVANDKQSTFVVFETPNNPCSGEHNVNGASTDEVQVPVSDSSDEGSSHVQESTSGTGSSYGLDIPISDVFSVENSSHVEIGGVDASTFDDGEEGIQPKDDFSSVLDSESIFVLKSSRNSSSGTICEQSCLSCIKFYRNFDVPLGKFLRDDLFSQSLQCKACGGLPQAHLYYYAHQNKQLTIRVKRLDRPLPREPEGKLWMWSCCGKCEPDKEKATKRVLVLTAARGLSLGKFLELSFSTHSSLNKLSRCGHSFQKDFLYFYGLGSMVAMFRYSRVATYEVSVPAQKLEFDSSISRVWIQQEWKNVYTKGLLLFTEVGKYLKKIESLFSGSNVVLDGSSKAFADIVDMLELERSEFEENFKNESSHNSVHKALSLYQLRWEILLEACIWDQRLQFLLSSRGWVWSPFAQIREECKKDLHQDYLPKFGHLPKFEPLLFLKVSQMITDEGSRLHIPISNSDYIVSDYDGEISSYAACALALIKDLKPASFKPSGMSLEGPIEPDTIHPAPSPPSLESHFPRFNGINQLDSLVSYGHVHHEVTLGIGKCPTQGKYSVVIMYASEFHGLRSRCCPSELYYIASLSRCKLWDAEGGKSKSLFSKTLDERLIIKEISKTELESFLKFAPDYFRYLNESLNSGSKTCLAKILGIYKVTIRHESGRETKHYLMVQENLLFGRNITRQYDLKGAWDARYTATGDGTGNVLLDQNFVNDMSSSPFYISKKAKMILERAIWNDTSFLSSINVTGYSLLVGVDRQQRELVCGIIDYLSQYTSVMELDTWMKTVFLPKGSSPTIVSPKEYKSRFRKFMAKHFQTVPDCSQRFSNPRLLFGIKS